MSTKDTWLNWYRDKRVEQSVAAFAEELKESGCLRVLDFGCGTGRNTVYLARLGFEVHGFDWSDKALRVANEALSTEGLKADLQAWDMNEAPLPYADSFFDAVLVMRVMHHTYLDKIRRIAAEIERISRLQGLLYVEVPAFEPGPRLTESEEPEPRTFVPLEGDEVGVPHHHFIKDELTSLFAGFTVLKIEERYRHYCLTAVRN